MFSSLSTYLSSLRHLLSLSPSLLYPAHGPVLPEGKASIQTYISHRQAREDQIVQVLRTGRTAAVAQPVPGAWEQDASSTGETDAAGLTTEEITNEVYRDVGVVLKVAAARGGE